MEQEIKERDETLNEYEVKFEKVKVIISEKDIEISNTKTQIAQIYDQYVQEKEQTKKLKKEIEIFKQ